MPTDPVSSDTASHYTWGDSCDGCHLVRTPTLSIIEERMPAGTAERRHVHGRAHQFFYVLAGELTMERDGTTYILSHGQGLEVAPGEPHQARNESRDEIRFLVTSQPPSHGDRADL